MARDNNLPEGVVMKQHNNESKKVQYVYDWKNTLVKILPGEKKDIPQWDEKYVQARKKEVEDNPFAQAIES